MVKHTQLRGLEAFENPRIVPLGEGLFAASFFLMKLLPARFMLERAVERGDLAAGGRICESSSGTFALALSMLAARHDYRLRIIGDWALDRGLRCRLSQLGTDLDIVEAPHPTGGYQQARLERLQQHLQDDPEIYWPAQYSNPDNPMSYSKVAAHIIDRVGPIDCLVGPVGSGGSMCGTAHHLRLVFPELEVIGVDTPGSVLFGQPNILRQVSGLGGGICPGNVDHTQFDEVHWLTAAEIMTATHVLHRTHGLFMGPTSGVATKVARWWRDRNPGKTVVAICPDEGHRYADTAYDESWLRANISGWGTPARAEPIPVPSPAVEMHGWSRFEWRRRDLTEVLSQNDPRKVEPQ